MVRATEIVIIAKVQNQASAQLRRLARDVSAIGRPDQLQRRMQQQQQSLLRQRGRLDAIGSRRQLEQLRHTERMLQLDRDLHTNMTSRMRLQQRLNQTADLSKQIILRRMIEATHAREDVLKARGNVYSAQQLATEKAISTQLKLQEMQRKQMLADMRLLQQQQLIQQKAGPLLAAGRATSHVGRSATFGGLLTTAGFAASSKMFADFSTLSTKAATQIEANANKGVDAVIASGRRLENAIMRQMMIFPASQNEMADALYNLFSSMTLTERQGTAMLANVNRMAVAFGSDLPTATNVAITTLNNFGGGVAGFNQTMDTLAAIVRVGRMELEDFDAMMNAVAPAAQGADQSLREMGGAMAVITRLIPSQERAATSLARLLDVFNMRDFQRGMEKAGVPILDVNGKLLSFVKIIERIASLDPQGPGLQNFIQNMTAFGKGKGVGVQSTAQARRALVQLVKHVDMLRAAQDDVNVSTGEFQQRFRAMMQSPGVQWQVFINQMRVLALEIGRDAIPAIISLMGWIKGLVARWRELSPGTREAIVKFAALTGVLMLIGGPIATVIGSIISLIGTLRLLTIVLGGAAGKGGTVGALASLLLLLGRLSLIGTIVITVALVFKKVGAWEKLEDLSLGITDKLGLTNGRPGDKSFFNPEAILPGMKTKSAKAMWDDIKNARDPVGSLEKAMADARKEVENSIKKNMLYEDIMKTVGAQIDGTANAQKQYTEEMKRWNQQRADTIRSAHEEYERIVDTAVDNMVAKYNELRDANSSAFGTLFQGPLLTGESFQEAQEWGISPGIAQINQDLKQQIAAFNGWKNDLRAVAKRGAPKQLVKELTDLGPDAADKIEVLRKASPKMFNNFVRLWKQKNAAIERETKRDFDNQLAIWQSHGKNMGLKIIAGLESESTHLSNTMRTILKNSFNGTVLSEVVSEALDEFYRNSPMPERPGGGGGGGANGGRGGGGRGGGGRGGFNTGVGAGAVAGGVRSPRAPYDPDPRGDKPGDINPSNSQQNINVTIVTTEPDVIAARRAGFIIAQRARRA